MITAREVPNNSTNQLPSLIVSNYNRFFIAECVLKAVLIEFVKGFPGLAPSPIRIKVLRLIPCPNLFCCRILIDLMPGRRVWLLLLFEMDSWDAS